MLTGMTNTRAGVLLALITTATLAATLTACSDDDAPPTRDTNATGGSEDELRQAVQAGVDAINSADTDAYLALQSAACREQVTPDETQQTFELIESLYGDIDLQTVEISDFDGATARVRGTTGIQALDEAGDQDGALWTWEDGGWRDDSCHEDVGQATAEDSTVPTDLAIGDTHNWDDGASLTITSVSQTPDSELGEFDREFITEGQTPITVAVTVTNSGDAPLDLSEFSFFVEGATTGGEAESQFFEGDEFLEGRLAPGQSRDHTEHYSFDIGQYGADITVEGFRMHEGMDLDSPIWAATIN